MKGNLARLNKTDKWTGAGIPHSPIVCYMFSSCIFVCEADLEVLMLFVRLFVSSNVENDGMMG